MCWLAEALRVVPMTPLFFLFSTREYPARPMSSLILDRREIYTSIIYSYIL